MPATADKKPRPFVHLHLHTQFSLLDGAIRIKDLMKRCKELGMPAVAVTDHGVMFGAVQVFKAAKKQGIKPIIGCELYVLEQGDYRDKVNDIKPNHVTLLVKNRTGYENLVKLVSEAYINGFYYKPRIDLNLLADNAEGLICLSGCLNGIINRHLLNGRPEKAEESALRLKGIFGRDNFFVEIQDHGLDEQRIIKKHLLGLATRHDLQIVATNDCHYVNADDYEAHDVLLCIGTGKLVKDSKRLKYESDQYYLKSGDEMSRIFQDEYSVALDNTLKIADMCEFDLEFGEYKLPSYEVPDGETIDSFFQKKAEEGFEKLLPTIRDKIDKKIVLATEQEYRERLGFEIDIIKKMGFSGYFLIVWDFINYAKQNGIPVGPGRGSGAGSLVAYSMGITGIDPIQFNLLFERFLNPERISMPDFDIDFCMRRRGEVIEYVTNKYGRKNVSQIVTFGTLGAKNAIRDVGRVMDMPYGEVDRIAKLVPDELGITLDKALKESPELKEVYESDNNIGKLIDIARRLEGLTRHSSTHAAGVVIAPKPLLNYCPLYKTSKDEITTQYDMNDVESIGLIKMDFLGLRTLTVLQDTVDAIKRDLGTEIDINNLPLDDKDTYALLGSGRAHGIFQFESRGMRDLLVRYKPERLEDLSALNALYRPGPIKGGLLDDFVERKHGRREVKFIHPAIKEITEETYGVILYQEQVIQIASVLAGFSLGEADLLRRAMGKKKKKLMAQQEKKFIEGAVAHNVKKKKAKEIFDYIDKFSGYGFNKSHSTAYGYIAYQTAYLKAHYPQYFMAALMSSEMEDSDRIKLYLAECRELGIEVLPPDVNRSFSQFTVEGGAIRFSLSAVKTVGTGAVDSIVRAREEYGGFTSIYNFCENVDLRSLNKRAVEHLVKAGCLDTISTNRAQLMTALDKAYDAGQKTQRDRRAGQVNLFEMMSAGEDTSQAGQALPDEPEWSTLEQLTYEKEALGFYLSGHPLAQYSEELRSLKTTRIDQLHNRKGNVTVSGIVTALRRRQTKAGKAMASFRLEDDTGTIETIIFPDLYAKIYGRVREDSVVVVSGTIKRESDSARIIASEIIPISEHKALEVKTVFLNLDLSQLNPTLIEELLGIIRTNSGQSPLVIRMKKSGEFDIDTRSKSFRISPSPGVISRLQELAGSENVIINSSRNHIPIS